MKKGTNKYTIIIVSFIPPIPLSHGGNRHVIYNLLSWLRRQGYHVIYVYQAINPPKEIRDTLETLVDELIVIGDVIGRERNQTNDKTSTVIVKAITIFRKYFLKVLQHIPEILASNIKNIAIRIIPGNILLRIYKNQSNTHNVRECWIETIEEVYFLAKRFDPLAVISEYIYMTPCFELLPKNVLKLTHTHDMLSRVKEEIGAYGVDTQGRECTQEEERHALLRGDVIIALQKNEARLFKELVPEREVIILGYSPWHIVPQPSNKVLPNRILNLGGDNVLNRRGLTLFCSNVWPRVLQSVPEAQFRVVGPVGTSLPPDTPNAKALGRLERVEEEYAKASIVVNPVDLGTGLKIKSVEALCYGKALVSTINGVEGMSLNNQQHCLIAKNWNDFSDKVISLLKDDKLRNRIEHEAVLYAKNHFTEEVVYAELKKCLEKSGNIK